MQNMQVRPQFTFTNEKNTMKTINHIKLERSGECALYLDISDQKPRNCQ